MLHRWKKAEPETLLEREKAEPERKSIAQDYSKTFDTFCKSVDLRTTYRNNKK